MDALSPASHLHAETAASTATQRAYMPSLEEVLRALAASGRLMHVTLCPSKNEWQASFRETGGSGYRVVIKADPVEALIGAMGPRWGDTWEKHLSNPSAPPLKAPKTKDVKRRKKLQEEEPFPDDIEDLL